MKVLILTPEVAAKARQGFIVSWINTLASKVEVLHVVTLDYDGETALPENVTVYNLGKRKTKLTKYLYFSRIIFNLLRKKAVDVIFCHMYVVFIFMVSPWVKPLRIPIVQWYAHGRVDLKLRIAHLIADTVVTPSRESFRIESNKVTITGHGIDTDIFRPAEQKGRRSKKRVVLSVGRISPVKDYETLIRAADILVNKKGMGNLEFIIAGGVPIPSQQKYYEKIVKLAQELGLANQVKFVGLIPHTEVVSYYQACDLFVNTSRTGSMDKAVLEAMACEKSVLTSNEAFKDMLADNAELLLFAPERPEELAEKIHGLLQMDDLEKMQLGASLRKIVETDHSVNHLMDRLVTVFEDYGDR
ncbi:MAG: glycosyltransferase family 4 protein [Desulfobacteraceae bacterium]|nr:glycosyltransferase family 4 protein [Desulfobacteraceae bacterium]